MTRLLGTVLLAVTLVFTGATVGPRAVAEVRGSEVYTTGTALVDPVRRCVDGPRCVQVDDLVHHLVRGQRPGP